jgi:hypothetical protein
VTTIEYELTADDYVAFNLHYIHTAPSARRQFRVYRLTVSLVSPLLILLIVGLLFDDILAGVVVATVSGVGLWFLARRSWMREMRKYLRRAAGREGLGTVGRCSLTIEDGGLRERSSQGETFVAWPSVDRIDETAGHAFIFFGPVQAFVIPKSAGDAVQPFLDEVRHRCVPAEQAHRLTSASS